MQSPDHHHWNPFTFYDFRNKWKITKFVSTCLSFPLFDQP